MLIVFRPIKAPGRSIRAGSSVLVVFFSSVVKPEVLHSGSGDSPPLQDCVVVFFVLFGYCMTNVCVSTAFDNGAEAAGGSDGKKAQC